MASMRERLFRDRYLLVILGLICIAYVIMSLTLGSRFFSVPNFQSMAIQLAEFGLLALAMGVAMLSGGIDLSIVSAAVLSGIVAAEILSGNVVPVTDSNHATLVAFAVLAALLVGLACGAFNGLLIAKVSIPPILATLATMIFFTGLSMAITNGSGVTIRVPEYTQISTITLGGVPIIFLIMCGMFVIFSILLGKSRTGRTLYLYGENKVATRFSGLRSERTIIWSYILIGLLVSVAALVMISRTNSARVGYGDSYLLQAILVVVLAGFDPYGGRGRVLSVGFGLVLLQSLQSAFTILQFNAFVKQFLWGSMLLLVMALNHFFGYLERRRLALGAERSAEAKRSAEGKVAAHV